MAWFGVTLLALLGLTAWRARPAAPAWSFGVLWVALSLFPVSNLIIPTGILLAERTLLLPSAGAMLMIGAALGWVAGTPWGAGTLGRTAVAAAAGSIIVIWGWRSVTRVAVWRNNETLIAATLADAPRSYKVHWDRARMLVHVGQGSAADREYRVAADLFPRDPRLLGELGDRQRDAGDCVGAIPLYRQALALDSTLWVTRTRLILCYARSGAAEEARRELAELERYGGGDPDRLRATIAALDSMQDRRRTAAP
jgi:tetratricopeptide (TPR) repeat protein